jgi:hypothetical protein
MAATATRMSTAHMSTARMAATWMAATWTSTAGPSAKAGSTAARSPNSWTSDVTAAMSAVPAAPSGAAAPAEATAKGITAPIEAGSAPAIVVPAVIPPAEDELSLFHIAWDCPRHEAMGGQCVGLANGAEQSQRD